MQKRDTKAGHFTHVYIENWRNFLRVDTNLQRRAFLVGPNASGKSNFLDLFRFLHDLVAVGGGFQAALKKRGGVSSLRSLSARRYPDVVLKVKFVNENERTEWEYELRFVQDNQARPIIKKESIRKQGQELFVRPNDSDTLDAERLTQTYLEQVNVNQEFREVVDFFKSIRYLHLVPQLVRDPDRSVGRKEDPFGGDFLEQVAGTNERIRNARLRRIQYALRVAVPQLRNIELKRDDRGTPHLRGKYENWRPRGAWQTEDQFSDGTLRLMGLLWATLNGNGPLLLEEPELSLHPEVVRFLPQMFARIQRREGRQILISTHSADLLKDNGIGLDEVMLLIPSLEGTTVKSAGQFSEIKKLLEGGLNLAEIVIPKTRPQQAEQLTLFGDMS